MPDSSPTPEPSRSSGRSTPRSLIDRLKRDEAAAWRELVVLYAPLIFHWCRRRRLSDEDCADILQDVFQSVVGHIGKFRKADPRDTFRGWLRTIAANKINDHFRRTGDQPRGEGGTEAQLRFSQLADEVGHAADIDEDETTAENALYRRALAMIREDFHEQTWQAFWRVVVDGRSAQEVGQELGMRPGTVRVAKSRVLRRLRKQLGDAE
jgi:RNA polymerase sigma-70 factor (ECF subfamily)